eukprot:1670437-Rhodomonas_salina.1
MWSGMVVSALVCVLSDVCNAGLGQCGHAREGCVWKQGVAMVMGGVGRQRNVEAAKARRLHDAVASGCGR